MPNGVAPTRQPRAVVDRHLRLVEEFGKEPLNNVAIYEELIGQLGGEPNYISPAARMTEQLDTKLVRAPVMRASTRWQQLVITQATHPAASKAVQPPVEGGITKGQRRPQLTHAPMGRDDALRISR